VRRSSMRLAAEATAPMLPCQEAWPHQTNLWQRTRPMGFFYDRNGQIRQSAPWRGFERVVIKHRPIITRHERPADRVEPLRRCAPIRAAVAAATLHTAKL
jgi:hypothetical protein